MTPSPNTKHQVVCGNLHWLLRSYLHQHPVGRVFFAPFDVVFSAFDVVEPDLLYMSHERATQILTEANVQGVPELVVEIASKSTRKRDETIKRRLYQRTGVAEYLGRRSRHRGRAHLSTRRYRHRLQPPDRAVAGSGRHAVDAPPPGLQRQPRSHLRSRAVAPFDSAHGPAGFPGPGKCRSSRRRRGAGLGTDD